MAIIWVEVITHSLMTLRTLRLSFRSWEGGGGGGGACQVRVSRWPHFESISFFRLCDFSCDFSPTISANIDRWYRTLSVISIIGISFKGILTKTIAISYRLFDISIARSSTISIMFTTIYHEFWTASVTWFHVIFHTRRIVTIDK